MDLGRHEHVFFDKSLFKHVEDLTRHFRVGESIYFNAILAPKESRAKWRATQVIVVCYNLLHTADGTITVQISIVLCAIE